MVGLDGCLPACLPAYRYNGLDNRVAVDPVTGAEVSAMEQLLTTSLRYVFGCAGKQKNTTGIAAVPCTPFPLHNIQFYAWALLMVFVGAFVRYCFFMRRAESTRWHRWMVAARDIGRGVVLAVAMTAVTLLAASRSGGGGDNGGGAAVNMQSVIRATLGVAFLNTLAAECVTLFARHGDDIRHLGDRAYAERTGPFAWILTQYRVVAERTALIPRFTNDAVVLRPVGRVLVFTVVMGFTSVLFSCLLQIVHAEHDLALVFGSFWAWLAFALVATVAFHVIRIVVRRHMGRETAARIRSGDHSGWQQQQQQQQQHAHQD